MENILTCLYISIELTTDVLRKEETTVQRLTSIDQEHATGRARDLLDATKSQLGMVPNLMKTLASSPAALDAYLHFSNALNHGLLPAKLRERLNVFIAESNRCQYCASAHTAIGKSVGIQESDLIAARQGVADDPKMASALRFAKAVLEKRGQVADEEIAMVREAGFGDGEITEIVAHVALNVYTNYFNNVAHTEVDFPKVELLGV
jgi:uncharacterized peroxidase-related enzyme